MTTAGVLHNFYLFRGAPPTDVAALEARAQRVHYLPNELVFREGEEAEGLYLVEFGTIEIFCCGDQTPLFTVGSAGGFGEVAFFDRGTRPASARTREASHLIRISFAALTAVLEERPAMAVVVYRNACTFLAKRLRRMLSAVSFTHELSQQRGGSDEYARGPGHTRDGESGPAQGRGNVTDIEKWRSGK